MPVDTASPPRLVSVPSFTRGAPGWRDAVRAHNVKVRALVADSLEYDNLELRRGRAADGHAAGSALIMSVADDARGHKENGWWRRLRKGRASADEDTVFGAFLLQAAERPGSDTERMVDLTAWRDADGAAHAAAAWTDTGAALLWRSHRKWVRVLGDGLVLGRPGCRRQVGSPVARARRPCA